MNKLILCILILLSYQLHAKNIAWKIQDTTSFNSIKSMNFSDNGDTLVVNNGNQLVFLNSKTGVEIKRLNSKMFSLISKDYNYGISSNMDTLFMQSTYTGDTISSFWGEGFKKAVTNRQMLLSRDNKLLIYPISNLYYPADQKYFERLGKIYFISTKTGEIINTLFGGKNDSLGFVEQIFFDSKDDNSIYISSFYYYLDDSNKIIIKRVYRYDLAIDKIDTLYSEYTEYDEFNRWNESLNIFPTQPYGCAKIENKIYFSFLLLYPYRATYEIEEGLMFKSQTMKDFNTILIAYPDNNNNMLLGKFKSREVGYLIKWFDRSNFELIDTYKNYDGNIWIVNNSPFNSFAGALLGKSELIMYVDSNLTNINNEIESNNLLIYPNPARDYIEISSGNVILNKVKDPCFKIYDLLGMEVFSGFATPPAPSQEGERIRIDVSHLSPGIYLVRVGDIVKKFVKF